MVKMVKLSDLTHERLKKYGKFGDSYDDIIARLLDSFEDKIKQQK
jgi:hypothetical protein